MAQVYFCGQLLQLQNLLVFFDGLHLHFGRCCSPRLCNYALARLFSCAIVFLCDCVVVRGSFVCNIFSFLCCYKTARLCCCICFLNNYAVTIKMSLCVCAIVFLCRVSCQRVLLYFCANEYSNTEYRTSTSTRPHNCATRCAFRLVRQTKGRFPKMGKKCFCRTMKFSPQNFSPQKPLALTGIQLQSRIKKQEEGANSPLAGATMQGRLETQTDRVSIHAPEGGATLWSQEPKISWKFQFTHHCKCSKIVLRTFLDTFAP